MAIESILPHIPRFLLRLVQKSIPTDLLRHRSDSGALTVEQLFPESTAERAEGTS